MSSKPVKIIKKADKQRQDLDEAIRRDEISLLRNLMRKYRDVAKDECRKLMAQTA